MKACSTRRWAQDRGWNLRTYLTGRLVEQWEGTFSVAAVSRQAFALTPIGLPVYQKVNCGALVPCALLRENLGWNDSTGSIVYAWK